VTAPALVTIRILDKEYQVNCPPEEQDALMKSAVVLDQRMRDIRKTGSVIGLERIAVMVALNLSHDLLTAESQVATGTVDSEQLQRLDDKLSTALKQLQSPNS
jgi:cell division protein ZapA